MKNTASRLALAIITASALAGLSLDAAAAGCDKPRNAFDQVYCISNLYSQADRDLNTQYGTLRKLLNQSQKDALKKGQLAWIQQRDEQCSYERPNGYYVNLSCAVETTQSRIDFLKKRERECRSTGCVSARMGD